MSLAYMLKGTGVVFGLLLARFVFGEAITTTNMVGAAIIICGITPHKSVIKEYLNPWVIGGYSLMVFSLVSNVYVLSQGVLLKELGTFFVHPLTYTLICHDTCAAMYHDILPARFTRRRIRSLYCR